MDMFTGIANIFTPPPRQAEHADARLDIRRHDPDEQRGNQGNDENAHDEGVAQDNASVSIEALRAFLENFLKTLEVDSQDKSADSLAKNARDEAAQEGVSAFQSAARPEPTPTARRAVSAYESAARSGKAPTQFSSNNMQSVAQSMGLSADEVRTIHSLLENLKILSARGLENLVIERSSSFLQSLSNAADKAIS